MIVRIAGCLGDAVAVEVVAPVKLAEYQLARAEARARFRAVRELCDGSALCAAHGRMVRRSYGRLLAMVRVGRGPLLEDFEAACEAATRS